MAWICGKCQTRYEEHPGRCLKDGCSLAPDLEGKELVGRYRIGRLIGAGGMGCVFEGLQLAVQRKVAIKFLPVKDPGIVARFRREALTVSQFEHHNTITVFDFGEAEDGTLFLVMELLDGRDLARVLKEEGALPLGRALHVFDQVLASLGEAHSRGIVHRDLKPENIFLVQRGEDPDFVKVLDFGLAKLFHGGTGQEALTQDGAIFGTPHYMSPEQAMGRPVDQRSDIYSAGVVLHQLLTGRFLFIADSLPIIMYKHVDALPPPLSEARPDLSFPPELEQYVLRLLEKDPERRPASTSEARSLLAPLLLAAQQLAGDLFSSLEPSRILRSSIAARAALSSSLSSSALGWRQDGRAAQPGEPAPPTGPEVEPDTRPDLQVGSGRRASLLPAILLAAIALLLLGGAVTGGLIWWWHRQPGPGSEPNGGVAMRGATLAPDAGRAARAEAAAPDGAPPPVPPLSLLVDSQPGGAEVRRDGKLLGTTPLRLELPR
ncbi:MAG: serine/threonine protein kinase, partial [Deltaproteobacteria bacterium]|nr:serine/threonine protein kinase [Deltaproteobacteria bacterium]